MNIFHKKIKNTISALITLLLVFPHAVSANQSGGGCINSFNTFGDIFIYITCIINSAIIPLIISLAIAMFMFGIVKFIANGDDETKRKEGRQFMLWGIIGLFVMLAIWGILQVLTSTFGFSFGVPQFQTR